MAVLWVWVIMRISKWMNCLVFTITYLHYIAVVHKSNRFFDFKTRERRKRYVTGSDDGNVRAGRSGTCV